MITKIYVTGSNTEGQVGLPLLERQFCLPRACHFGVQIKQVSCGFYHTLFLLQAGWVYQAGNKAQSPWIVHPLQKITQVECGGYHNLAMTQENQLYSWGKGEDGQLGLGQTQDVQVPQLINIECKQYKLALGAYHTIVWEGQDVYVCGRGTLGQLGLGNNKSISILTKIPNMNQEIEQISCGQSHTLILTGNQTILGFGDNTLGQLGPLVGKFALSPVDLVVPVKPVQISAGRKVSVVVDQEGKLYTWGQVEGQVVQKPQLIKHNEKICQMKVNGDTFAFRDFQGDIYCWGYNSFGELGHGDLQDRVKPAKVNALKLVTQFCFGETHGVFITEEPINEDMTQGSISQDSEQKFYNTTSSSQTISNQRSPEFNQASASLTVSEDIGFTTQPFEEQTNSLFKDCMYFTKKKTNSQNERINKENLNLNKTVKASSQVQSILQKWEKENQQTTELVNSLQEKLTIPKLEIQKISSLDTQSNIDESSFRQSFNCILKDKKIAELQLELSQKDEVISILQQKLLIVERQNQQNELLLKDMKKYYQ